MNLSSLDWAAVTRLREIFLEGGPQRRAYWTSPADLQAYDLTLGERIGWKWDSVLGELTAARWKPPVGPLVDFGCGSGVAGRRVLAAFGAGHFTGLRLHDRSGIAESFALGRARELFPELPGSVLSAAELDGDGPLGTLVISHVLSEMAERDRAKLVRLARRAAAVLWVEPGTHADSRALIDVREALRGEYDLIAPCTHCESCGLLAPERSADWCHFFGRPPWEIFTDSSWSEFADRLGVDLRSLPFSFLVLQRRGEGTSPAAQHGLTRTLGRARIYKGYAKIFACDKDGVGEVTLQKRDAPEHYKAMKDGDASPLQRWRRDGDRVRPAEPSQ